MVVYSTDTVGWNLRPLAPEGEWHLDWYKDSMEVAKEIGHSKQTNKKYQNLGTVYSKEKEKKSELGWKPWKYGRTSVNRRRGTM